MSKLQLCSLVALLLVWLGVSSAVTATDDAIAAAAPISTSTRAVLSQSGQSAPVGDLPGWRQIFSDDFTTDVPLGSFPSAVAGRWSAYPYPGKDTHNGIYWPQKVVSIHDGVMDLYLHTENNLHLAAAPIPRLPGASSANGMLYGRYAIRFKSDPIAGYKTAWLLWPDSGVWPRDGEIDFPEAGLDDPICGYMHRQGGGGQDVYCTGATYPTWHIAVIEWTPQRLTFILDDKVIGNSTSNIPNTPMHWVIQTETNTIAPTISAAGHVQIDWVAAYKPDASSNPAATTPAAAPSQPGVPGATAGNGSVAPSATAPGSNGDNAISTDQGSPYDTDRAQTRPRHSSPPGSPPRPGKRNEPEAARDPWPASPRLLCEAVQNSVRGLAALHVEDLMERGVSLGLDAIRRGLQQVGDLLHRGYR